MLSSKMELMGAFATLELYRAVPANVDGDFVDGVCVREGVLI